MMKDPVCGKQVDETRAPMATHGGKRYVFCGRECKQRFEANPEEFAGGGTPEGRSVISIQRRHRYGTNLRSEGSSQPDAAFSAVSVILTSTGFIGCPSESIF